MEEFDYKLSFLGYDKGCVDEIICEKNRLIELQQRDMQSLKREIAYLKQKINYSGKKKK